MKDLRMDVLLATILLLTSASAAVAASWEGTYIPPDQRPNDGTQVSWSLHQCGPGYCRFSYAFAGHHACSYEGDLTVTGNTAKHHAEEKISDEDTWTCDIVIRRRNTTRERTISVDGSGQCEAIAACGVMANIAVGDFVIPQSRPSFDCLKARQPIEKIICGSIPLGEQDAKLAAVFKRLRSQRLSLLPSLVDDQRRWFKERDRCVLSTGIEELCLERAYNKRVGVLIEIDQYVRILSTVSGEVPATPWQASGLAELAAKANRNTDAADVVSLLEGSILGRWLSRATGGVLADDIGRGGVYCDELEIRVSAGNVVLARSSCPEPGPFTLEASDGGNLWLVHMNGNTARVVNTQGKDLTEAPDAIMKWLTKFETATDARGSIQPSTLDWPEPAVIASACFWSDKTLREWAEFFLENHYDLLAEDAKRRAELCGSQRQ